MFSKVKGHYRANETMHRFALVLPSFPFQNRPDGHRRKWDKDEYEKKAKERIRAVNEEAAAAVAAAGGQSKPSVSGGGGYMNSGYQGRHTFTFYTIHHYQHLEGLMSIFIHWLVKLTQYGFFLRGSLANIGVFRDTFWMNAQKFWPENSFSFFKNVFKHYVCDTIKHFLLFTYTI